MRLFNISTQTWVRGTTYSIDEEEDKPIMTKVGLFPEKDDKEAFALLPVPVQEVRDLDFATDASQELNRFSSDLDANSATNVGRMSIGYEPYNIISHHSFKFLLLIFLIFAYQADKQFVDRDFVLCGLSRK